MKFEIKNRWTLKVQFECELEAKFETERYGVQLGAAIKAAYKSGAVLSDAVLSGADLSGADLSGADLSGADLSGADLSGAVLSDAVLSGAVLSGAVLSGADLSGADLSGAVLSGAVLSGADLSGADLSGADLSGLKNDLFAVLLRAPHEVDGLALALKEGRVNGSVYEGECACLIGTIANLKHCSHEEVPGLAPDSNRPAERWFLGINRGDTTETNQIVKITLEWIEEFQSLMAAAMPQKV